MDEKFDIKFLKGVIDFLDGIDEKACDKILFNIDKVRIEPDKKLFKKLNPNIWEFQTLHNKKQYRLFAFWDKTDNILTMVVATHGIIKKSQKTPSKEIEKAKELMKNYFEDKK